MAPPKILNRSVVILLGWDSELDVDYEHESNRGAPEAEPHFDRDVVHFSEGHCSNYLHAG